MGVAGVSIVIAAASVVVASTFYSFQIKNQTRVRKTHLVMQARERFDPRLYEHFEFLYDEMTRRAARVQPAFATSRTGAVAASRNG